MKRQTCAVVSRALAVAAVVVALATVTLAQTETILYTFPGGDSGLVPLGGLILDSQGNLYGTTAGGGTGIGGTIFELTTSNGTWSEQVLYNFNPFNLGDGNAPSGGLVFDGKGNLYGTTYFGGTYVNGTVFELTPGSNNTWTQKILYGFTGGADGGYPYWQGVVLDSSGNVYGTTERGGAHGFGTVFELVAGTGGTFAENVLYSFKGVNDGASPLGTLIFDKAGNLYGTTEYGGSYDYGVAFQLKRGSGGAWTERVLYSFPGGSGGSLPSGNLVFDNAGNLYGAATYIVYELIPSSAGAWTEKTVHSFAGGSDGSNVEAGLIIDKTGSLFGTTNTGGNHRGTVFELSPSSNGIWTEKILHRFSSSGVDGTFPAYGSLVLDAKGNLYGTTPEGGTANLGVVYKIMP